MQTAILNFIDSFFFGSIVAAALFFLIILFGVGFLDKRVIRWIARKRKRSNLGVILHSIRYFLIIIFLYILISPHLSPDTDYSVVFGFISAALGFALQKPITGVAAWLVIVLKRPFYIGDRIIIGDVKGDVIDITLSHIVLQEAGGTVTSEDSSGRIIHVPVLRLFDEHVINYTLNDEYILDEVTVLIEYESNLEKAEFLIHKAANQVLKALDTKSTGEPYIRLFFDESGVNIKLRYLVPSRRRQEISSDIVRLIHQEFAKEKDITIAYPHMKLVNSKGEFTAATKKKQQDAKKKILANKKVQINTEKKKVNEEKKNAEKNKTSTEKKENE